MTAHYVADYRALVAKLIREHPIDEAMALAVGGHYKAIGELELEAVNLYAPRWFKHIIDVGCGSGRLTAALQASGWDGHYVGIDIVPELLAHAKEGAPTGWEFQLSEGLEITCEAQWADVVCFFSVLTHLRPEEGYVYLREAYRTLRTSGVCLVSYLDYAQHWSIFEGVVGTPNGQDHLTTFLSRDTLATWAAHLGFAVEAFVDDKRFGQNLAVLVK